jgi:hypothetical protein
MTSRSKLGIMFLSAVVAAGTCFAQKPTEDAKYYHLDFVVKELESGKVINTRSYMMTVATGAGTSVIRSGSKVPISTGGEAPGSSTYLDMGVNIDCRAAKEIQDQLALSVSAEIASVATESPSNRPLIRQTKWESIVIVPVRKPTTIFSSDDPTTKRQTQLELTAVPIK